MSSFPLMSGAYNTCIQMFYTKIRKFTFMLIGLLSDTHGWIHPRLFEYFSNCDEIWHAGDIGNLETADRLASFKPFRAVYGNIDGAPVRIVYPEDLRFETEGVSVWMTHIGGTPGHYDERIRNTIDETSINRFICGHSHIAKIMFDKKGSFLFVKPGAAGYTGFHKY